MARGWESKSVEAQQDASRERRPAGPRLTPQQIAAATERKTLELARSRAEADLARATAPAYRTMLQQTIAALDRRLRELT